MAPVVPEEEHGNVCAGEREMTIFLPREVDRSPSVRLDPWAQLDIRVYLALL